MDKYDPLGKPKEQTQKFRAVAGNDWGQAFTTKLDCNLAGGVISQTYPSQHKVEYQYDAAGRLSDNGQLLAFKGNLGDGAEKTYASQISYDELGGMREEKFGTQVPLYHKLHYNARGQLYDVRLSTVPWAADQWEWNRGAVVNYYGGSCRWQTSDATNNGNLRCSEHAVPLDPDASYTPGAVGAYATSFQTYTYDALNRLEGVAEKQYKTGESLTPAFTQAYRYDRWGNRTINAAATQVYGQNPTYTIPEPQFELSPQTNQEVPEPSNRLYTPGDAGRAASQKLMRYDPVGNLVHDAYTGDGARVYDAENRMTAAIGRDGVWAYYTYDADGQRVRRKAGAEAEVWQAYGVGGELLAQYAANASHKRPRKEYGYRGGELPVTAEAPTRYNVALASNGATATAQSYTPDSAYPGLHFQPS